MLVVNISGGPGCGKSLCAGYLYSKLKALGYSCEYVSEYAKFVIWEDHHSKFNDQLYITSKQNRKLHVLRDKVDVAVTDSPLYQGLCYVDSDYLDGTFEPMVRSLYHSYTNDVYFLERNPDIEYENLGRVQTLEESIIIDSEVKKFLYNEGIQYKTFMSSYENYDEIIRHIVAKLEHHQSL